jgi:hypothetical protein
MVASPPAYPRSSTRYRLMLLVPRSVTRSIVPSGVKDTWAESAPESLSARDEPGSPVSRPSATRNPLMLADLLLST